MGAAVAGLVYNVGKVVYMEVTPKTTIAAACYHLPSESLRDTSPL